MVLGPFAVRAASIAAASAAAVLPIPVDAQQDGDLLNEVH